MRKRARAFRIFLAATALTVGSFAVMASPAEAVSEPSTASAALIDGPLIDGPLVDLSGLNRLVQLGQFQ